MAKPRMQKEQNNHNELIELKAKKDITIKIVDEIVSKTTKRVKQITPKPGLSVVTKSVPPNMETFYLASKRLVAIGYVNVNDNYFIVLKGSQISGNIRKCCSKWVQNQREKLIAAGKITDGTFTEDVSFRSPSAAASVINGGDTNGLMMWRNEEGISIKALRSIK